MVTPGGALLPGETYEAAACRELEEEIGWRPPVLGPVVWHRQHTVRWKGEDFLQRERFFLVRIETLAIDTRRFTPDEVDVVTEHRWWTTGEIAASDEVFAPRRLADFLTPLLRGGPPAAPIDVGI